MAGVCADFSTFINRLWWKTPPGAFFCPFFPCKENSFTPVGFLGKTAKKAAVFGVRGAFQVWRTRDLGGKGNPFTDGKRISVRPLRWKMFPCSAGYEFVMNLKMDFHHFRRNDRAILHEYTHHGREIGKKMGLLFLRPRRLQSCNFLNST